MEEVMVNNDGMSVMQRMDMFLAHLKQCDNKLTDNRVAGMCGLTSGIFTNGRKRNALAYTTVMAIAKTFPELDTDWVLFGKGEMLRKRADQSVGQLTIIEFLKEWNETLRKENEALRLENAKLKICCTEKMLMPQQSDNQ